MSLLNEKRESNDFHLLFLICPYMWPLSYSPPPCLWGVKRCFNMSIIRSISIPDRSVNSQTQSATHTSPWLTVESLLEKKSKQCQKKLLKEWKRELEREERSATPAQLHCVVGVHVRMLLLGKLEKKVWSLRLEGVGGGGLWGCSS